MAMIVPLPAGAALAKIVAATHNTSVVCFFFVSLFC